MEESEPSRDMADKRKIDFKIYKPSMYETLKSIKEQEIVSTDLPRHNYS
jgi:hypothetical protein